MITIKQAAEQTGKSELTIRRLIKQTLINNPKAEGKLITRGQKGAYLISDKLLASTYGTQTTSNVPNEPIAQSVPLTTDTSVITLLHDTVNLLKDQLAIKDSQISDLTKAQERSDVLLRDIQARLALPTPKPEVDSIIRPGHVIMPSDSAMQHPAPHSYVPDLDKPKKRGWFRRR